MKYKSGDILKSDCEALVNTVNCFGVMGKGLALQFKKAFPEMFLAYKRDCDFKKVKIGKMHVWKGEKKWIINFPTKYHWRYPSKMEWISEGLIDLVKVLRDNKIKSVAMPPLGCGFGGLHFYLVKKEIEKIDWSGITTEVYLPE